MVCGRSCRRLSLCWGRAQMGVCRTRPRRRSSRGTNERSVFLLNYIDSHLHRATMGNEVSAPVSAAGVAASEQDPGTPTVSRPALGDDGAKQRPTPSALVVVGPSGVGKGTLITKLMEGSGQFGFSTSHTTRQPRAGERVSFLYIQQAWSVRLLLSSTHDIAPAIYASEHTMLM